MGYNVVTNGPGTGTVTAFYALVGCLRPLASQLPGRQIEYYLPVLFQTLNRQGWGGSVLELQAQQHRRSGMRPDRNPAIEACLSSLLKGWAFTSSKRLLFALDSVDAAQVTHNHVVLEAWPEAYAAEIQEVESLCPDAGGLQEDFRAWQLTGVGEFSELVVVQFSMFSTALLWPSRYPSMAPVSLGSMGYDGTTGIFFPSKILDSAYHDAGIALDYFRGWNHSWSPA